MTTTAPAASAPPAVALEGVGRAYGERVALRDISLTLAPGATVAVFGANGAGKTTLLRILAGLLRPHAGRARVLGAELPREGWKARGRIGLLGHEPLLYRDLTVRENLRFHARLHGVDPARAPALIEQAGLTGRADDPVRTLSRGMTQRAAICRAVLHAPELLLLDEPLANLDPGGATASAGAHLPRRRTGTRRGRLGARPARRAAGDLGACGAGGAGRPAGALRVRSTVAALVRKDLQLERRAFESVPAMLMFSISTFVLFRFGLDRSSLEGDLASGVLWVTLLLAAVLGMNRLFVAEREQGGFDGFLMAPVDRTALFVSKALVLFCFLIAVELVALPAFVVLLLQPPAGQALPELLGVVALADAGIAVVGTLVGALGVQTRARDLIVPLMALPLLVPVVIAAAEATAPLFATGGAGAFPGRWLVVLALYDAVFGLLAYAVFDYLLEE